MKISTRFACVLLTSAFLAPSVFAKKLEVDPAHSVIAFEATHLKVSKIPGRFDEFVGTIDLDEKDFTKSKIDFTVNIASITTSVAKRDSHLKTPDFFNSDKFPKATFKSTEIVKSGDEYKLTGDLTIRDITKKVTFEVENHGKVNDPTAKKDKYMFNAKGEINRKDFGINYGPDEIVGDKVSLWINLETIAATGK